MFTLAPAAGFWAEVDDKRQQPTTIAKSSEGVLLGLIPNLLRGKTASPGFREHLRVAPGARDVGKGLRSVFGAYALKLSEYLPGSVTVSIAVPINF
jgi:hypothetical protein